MARIVTDLPRFEVIQVWAPHVWHVVDRHRFTIDVVGFGVTRLDPALTITTVTVEAGPALLDLITARVGLTAGLRIP